MTMILHLEEGLSMTIVMFNQVMSYRVFLHCAHFASFIVRIVSSHTLMSSGPPVALRSPVVNVWEK